MTTNRSTSGELVVNDLTNAELVAMTFDRQIKIIFLLFVVIIIYLLSSLLLLLMFLLLLSFIISYSLRVF